MSLIFKVAYARGVQHALVNTGAIRKYANEAEADAAAEPLASFIEGKMYRICHNGTLYGGKLEKVEHQVNLADIIQKTSAEKFKGDDNCSKIKPICKNYRNKLQ